MESNGFNDRAGFVDGSLEVAVENDRTEPAVLADRPRDRRIRQADDHDFATAAVINDVAEPVSRSAVLAEQSVAGIDFSL